MNWQTWVIYPLSFFFATMFGFLMTKIPQYACWWLGLWLTYIVASNVIYNVPFAFINTNTIAWYWIIIAISEILVLTFFIKTRPIFKKDKTFHLIWEAPVFGGFLLGICWIILDKNAAHSIEFALIRMDLGNAFKPGMGYVYALLTWLLCAILGFLSHLYVAPKIAEKVEEKWPTKKEETRDTETTDTETLRTYSNESD